MKSDFLDSLVGKTVTVVLTDGQKAVGELRKNGNVYNIYMPGKRMVQYFRASAVRSISVVEEEETEDGNR